jgi:hypothetical protein
MVDFNALLDRAFPYETYANTLRALKQGIANADATIKGTPLLNNPTGQDLRGLIRRVGILQQFDRMCKAGDLPFRSEMAQMPIGTWHWLNIWSGDVLAHIVRTEEPDKFPEDTLNRQDRRARNNEDLFEPKIVSIEPMKLYAWLCYRALPNGALAHAVWGFPAADAEEWLARKNLMNVVIPKKEDDPGRPAKVDPKDKLKLREIADIIIQDKKET